jgi:hypothetical protein
VEGYIWNNIRGVWVPGKRLLEQMTLQQQQNVRKRKKKKKGGTIGKTTAATTTGTMVRTPPANRKKKATGTPQAGSNSNYAEDVPAMAVLQRKTTLPTSIPDESEEKHQDHGDDGTATGRHNSGGRVSQWRQSPPGKRDSPLYSNKRTIVKRQRRALPLNPIDEGKLLEDMDTSTTTRSQRQGMEDEDDCYSRSGAASPHQSKQSRWSSPQQQEGAGGKKAILPVHDPYHAGSAWKEPPWQEGEPELTLYEKHRKARPTPTGTVQFSIAGVRREGGVVPEYFWRYPSVW